MKTIKFRVQSIYHGPSSSKVSATCVSALDEHFVALQIYTLTGAFSEITPEQEFELQMPDALFEITYTEQKNVVLAEQARLAAAGESLPTAHTRYVPSEEEIRRADESLIRGVLANLECLRGESLESAKKQVAEFKGRTRT